MAEIIKVNDPLFESEGYIVFEGTHVPVQLLIDYLEIGESIDDFVRDFPEVSREQVTRFFDAMNDDSEHRQEKDEKPAHEASSSAA